MATQLADEGISGFLTPVTQFRTQAAPQGFVAFYVQPGCYVNLAITHVGSTVVLASSWSDATHRLIGEVDSVHDAGTAALVRSNLVAAIQASPKNGVCK